ncbi:hypothetical protein DXB27_04535 [Parabacteroides gordonii]|jgi:hypothetical protein|uniref:CAAX amino terminal protease n=2 Tax=Parabacteroides gordonii TaxID=574930 RepID=A0A0F5JJH6_9BACT|nr:hypothetical protein HMPREF1536_01785 [Parabacteroides gordonii MS-1 = DSM 23371]RGP17489.1 hypothetical protein DXB27_04535 [Parabacteroides gordonii]
MQPLKDIARNNLIQINKNSDSSVSINLTLPQSSMEHSIKPSSKIQAYELIKTIFIYWVGTFICKIAVKIAETYILPYYHVQSPSIELEEFLRHIQSILGAFTPYYIILIGPLIEEACFRLGLSFKKRDIFIGGYTLFVVVFINITGKLYSLNLWKVSVLLVVLLGVIYLYKKTKQEIFTKVRNKYGKGITYLFIVLFALMHMSNFSSFELGQLSYFVCYFSYLFIISYSITRLRIYNGFWWGYGLHAVNNAFAVLATSGI